LVAVHPKPTIIWSGISVEIVLDWMSSLTWKTQAVVGMSAALSIGKELPLFERKLANPSNCFSFFR